MEDQRRLVWINIKYYLINKALKIIKICIILCGENHENMQEKFFLTNYGKKIHNFYLIYKFNNLK